MENRLYYNRDLIDRLSTYLEANPDIRFSQALMNCYYVEQELIGSTEYPVYVWRDEFYLESSELHGRVVEAMEGNK
jgi:hypothetical protein